MSNQLSQDHLSGDEVYLRIWEIEREYSGQRWTIATFFFGISFAILGISFQTVDSKILITMQYFAAVTSYWFGYFFFNRLNDFTYFLRNYLLELEMSGKVSLNAQSKIREHMGKGRSTTKLIRIFGALYSAVIFVVLILLLIE